MAEQFYTILTAIGKAKMANTTALGTKVNLTKFQVGDGNGTYYNPTEDQTGLKHKTWEGPISSITVDENNPNWIVIEVIIPSNVGGFMIREAGVFDDEGNMIAIGKYPETYKPVASNGSTKDLIIKMILEVSNTSSVTLKVDPTVILATQKDIQVLNNRIGNIKVPVQSVNGKTGKVTLKAEDITAKDGTNLEKFKENVTTQYEDCTKKLKDVIVETGVWTPTLLISENIGTIKYRIQKGYYKRIGGRVFLEGWITTESKDSNLKGNVTIGGLPFKAQNLPYKTYGVCFGKTSNMPNINNLLGTLADTRNYIILYNKTNAQFTQITEDNLLNGTEIAFSLNYEIN